MSAKYIYDGYEYQTTNAKGCRSTIMSTNIEQIKMFEGKMKQGDEWMDGWRERKEYTEQLILLYGMLYDDDGSIFEMELIDGST